MHVVHESPHLDGFIKSSRLLLSEQSRVPQFGEQFIGAAASNSPFLICHLDDLGGGHWFVDQRKNVLCAVLLFASGLILTPSRGAFLTLSALKSERTHTQPSKSARACKISRETRSTFA